MLDRPSAVAGDVGVAGGRAGGGNAALSASPRWYAAMWRWWVGLGIRTFGAGTPTFSLVTSVVAQRFTAPRRTRRCLTEATSQRRLRAGSDRHLVSAESSGLAVADSRAGVSAAR